jgi:glycosyltransferase involved in cell wall biosynthesis
MKVISTFSLPRMQGRPTADMTDLSIVAIIPLYNGAKWIEGTMRSVFAQTLQPDEFLVVDDGSTDGGAGASIVERLARERPITLLHKSNGGQSVARNFAVTHSKSALIALLDQDDYWYPDHLEVLRAEFEKHRGTPLGWAYSDFDEIDGDGRMVDRAVLSRHISEHPKRHLMNILRNGVIIQPSATLISRNAFEAIGGFDEHLCGYEDDDLFLRIFLSRFDNVFVSTPTSAWRVHDSSSGASDQLDASLRYYIQKLLSTFPDDRWRGNYYARDAIAPRYISVWMVMYIRASRYNNYIKMREYARQALVLVPLLGLKRRRFVYSIMFPILQFPRLGMAMIVVYRLAARVLHMMLGRLSVAVEP